MLNMSETSGHELNPWRRLRNSKGVKGTRQNVVITNNPSTINENQLLTVRFSKRKFILKFKEMRCIL